MGAGRRPAGVRFRLERHHLLLGLGALAAVVVRLVVSRDATGPLIVADEAAYLSMARRIAHVGGPWLLLRSRGYAIGYSVLVAPLFRLLGDPHTVYRSIMVLNALLGGLLVPVFEAIARRVSDLRRIQTVVIATVAACLPTLVVASARAWSDALAPLALALLVLATIRVVEHPSTGRILALVVLQVTAGAVHNRFLPLTVVTVGVLVALTVRHRIRPSRVLWAAGSIVVGVVAVRYLTAVVHEPLHGVDAASLKGGDVTRVRLIRPLALSAAGQIWYLLATSLGVAGIGLLVLVRRVGVDLVSWAGRFRSRDGEVPPARGDTAPVADVGSGWVHRLAFAHIGLSIAISVVFMTDRAGPQRLLYGRYNDAVVGLLVVLGATTLASAVTSRRHRIVAAAATASTLVASALLIGTFRADLLAGRFQSAPIMGLVPFGTLEGGIVRRATIVAVLAIVIWSTVSVVRPIRTTILALLAVVTIVGLVRIDDRLDLSAGDRFAAIADAPLRPGDLVRIDTFDGARVQARFRYPFFAPDVAFREIKSESYRRRLELVIGGIGEQDARDAGYRVLWADPRTPNVLWVQPGERQSEAARRGELLPEEPTGPAPGDDAVTVEADLTRRTDRLTGLVTVHRPAGGPWMGAADESAVTAGRVRVRVTVRPDCDCEPVVTHLDLGRFVEAGEPEVHLPVDIGLDPEEPGPLEVEVRTVRTGDGPVGSPLTLTVT